MEKTGKRRRQHPKDKPPSLPCFFISGLMLFLSVAAVRPAAAGEAFVSSKAGEGGDGSFDRPFKSIQDALESLKGCGSINVAAGIYRANLLIEDRNCGGDDPLVLRALEKGKASLTGRGQSYGIMVRGSTGVRIEGFEIRNADVGVAIAANAGTGPDTPKPHPITENITLKDNEFTELNLGIRTFWEQLRLGPEEAKPDSKTSRIAGIRIEGNRFHGLKTGVEIPDNLYCRDVSIIGNLFYAYEKFGVDVGRCDNVTLDRNTWASGEAAVRFAPTENDWGIVKGSLKNSVIAFNRSYGLILDMNYASLGEVDHMLFWSNKIGDVYLGPDRPASDLDLGDRVLREDPKFNDSSRGDYTLHENSPCIDAGGRSPEGHRGAAWDLGYAEAR